VDEVTKYRITGAVIWLALLIIFVPSWYSHPVDYQQQQSWATPVEVLSDEALPEPKESVSETSDLAQDVKDESGLKNETKVTPLVPAKPDTSTSQPQVGSPSKPLKQMDVSGEKTDAKEASSPEVISEPEPAKTTEPPHQVEREVVPEEKSPAWLIRVASYSSIKSANRTLGLLELRYQVTIGDFSTENRKIYSVRVGPYYSFEEAQKVKQALDAELNTNSVIVQIR
jgi:cell division septation protein DedD